jgi:hypothetical protein
LSLVSVPLEFLALPAGPAASRTPGCEFIGMTKNVQMLIEQFIVQLDRTDFQPRTEEKK